MQKCNINAEHAPQPASAYSQAVEVTGDARILFISGQLGTEATERAARNGRTSTPCLAQSCGATGGGRHGARQPREGDDDHPGCRRNSNQPRRPCGGIGRPAPGQHRYRRRPRQSSLENRDRRHRIRLISSPTLGNNPTRLFPAASTSGDSANRGLLWVPFPETFCPAGNHTLGME